MDKIVMTIVFICFILVTLYDTYYADLAHHGIASYSSAFDAATSQLGSLSSASNFSLVSNLPPIKDSPDVPSLDPSILIQNSRNPPSGSGRQPTATNDSYSNGTTASSSKSNALKIGSPFQLSQLGILSEGPTASMLNSLSSFFVSLDPVIGSMSQLPIINPFLNVSVSSGYWDPLGRVAALSALAEFAPSINMTDLTDYMNQTQIGALQGTALPFSGVPDVQSLSEIYSSSQLINNLNTILSVMQQCQAFTGANSSGSAVTLPLYGISVPYPNLTITGVSPQFIATNHIGGPGYITYATNFDELVPAWLSSAFESDSHGINALLDGTNVKCTQYYTQSNYTVYNVTPTQQAYMYALSQYESDAVSQLVYNETIKPEINFIGYSGNETLIDFNNLNLSQRSTPIIKIDNNVVGYSRYFNFFLVHQPLSEGNHEISAFVGNITSTATLTVEPYIPFSYALLNASNSTLSLFMPGSTNYPKITQFNGFELLNATGAVLATYNSIAASSNYTDVNFTQKTSCLSVRERAYQIDFSTVYGNSSYFFYAVCS